MDADVTHSLEHARDGSLLTETRQRPAKCNEPRIMKIRRRSIAGDREEQFLRVLEKLLMGVIMTPNNRGKYSQRNGSQSFAKTLWMSRWIGDPEKSLLFVLNQHWGSMHRLHEAIYTAPASNAANAPFILTSGKPSIPTHEAIFVWERMRHRMLRAESKIGRYLFRRFERH